MFLVSVAIRLPNLNRPLSKHHEFNAAMVLVGCEGWAAAGGPQKTNFCPLINYPNPGDVYYVTHPQVKDGKLYYLSFGPGQFLVPYYAGKLLHVPYSPLLLQIINLLAHLISAWFLYRVVMLLTGNKDDTVAKIAVSFFFFSTETLWFFGNGYVHESMVMPFFAAGIYYALRMFTGDAPVKQKTVLLFGTIVCAGIFFDWLMAFFAAGVGLIALYRIIKKEKRYWPLLIATAVGAVAATVCIIWMYSSYYGAGRFWNLLLNKYGNRNGFSGDTSVNGGKIITGMLKHFATGYLPLILLLGTGLFFSIKKRMVVPRSMNMFLLLNIAVVGYFIAFASFSSEHDYSVLKFSLIISALAAFAVTAISNKKNVQLGIALLIVLLNTGLNYYINPPGKKGFNGDAYALEKNAGVFIKNNVQPDELVLHNMKNANWLSVYYYSKRNNTFMPDADSAYRFFLTTPLKKMVFVDFDGTDWKAIKKQR